MPPAAPRVSRQVQCEAFGQLRQQVSSGGAESEAAACGGQGRAELGTAGQGAGHTEAREEGKLLLLLRQSSWFWAVSLAHNEC